MTDDQKYNCPVCSKTLTQGSNSFYCTHSHGQLITARKLSEIGDQQFAELDGDSTVRSDHIIECPVCGESMHPVDYNGTGIIIDACTRCHHRWFDNTEIKKIKDHIPKISPEDLLLIENLERERDSEELLPDVGSLKYARHIYGASHAAASLTGKDGLRLSALGVMAASGFMGTLKLLLHSNFARLLLIIILVVFGLLYFYVFSELG